MGGLESISVGGLKSDGGGKRRRDGRVGMG